MTEKLTIVMNDQTKNQMLGLILLHCIKVCNEAKLPEVEYNQKLRAMLRERLDPDGQKELESLL